MTTTKQMQIAAMLIGASAHRTGARARAIALPIALPIARLDPFAWGLRILFVAALALLLGACGNQVPKQFQGTFVDETTGSSLKLTADAGEFLAPDGRVLKAKRQELDADDLLRLKAGIYTRLNPINKELLEIYWVSPLPATKQSAGGMTWYEAEVLFMRMPTKLDRKVDQLQLVHSVRGNVMIDEQDKKWQVGWPAGSSLLTMKRKK